MATATERITKTPGVCGGDACIRGHRIPVWVLEGYCRLGSSDAELLSYYPFLVQADLDPAWEYAAVYKGEIDRNLRENEEGDGGLVE
jgi:uncharacterized protein (DUF433 family)